MRNREQAVIETTKAVHWTRLFREPDLTRIKTWLASALLGFMALGLSAGVPVGAQAASPSSPAKPAMLAPPASFQLPTVVVMIRHSETEPGFGDPPNFQLEDCSTQRNLSTSGREQSRQIGQWFRDRGLEPTAVRSSQWCRCLDTARLAFGERGYSPWPALNSFFQGHGNRSAQLAEARARGAALPHGLEVWVTHQVTISALTGYSPAMGEMVVTRPDGQGGFAVLDRIRIN